MSGDPIVIHGPSLGDIAALLAVGGCLIAAAVLLVGWLVILGAPLPARTPGPWWSPATLAAVVRHTVARARRLHHGAQPPPTLDDAPTVHLNLPLSVPRQREGDHDDDH